jgi:hypothetical protein
MIRTRGFTSFQGNRHPGCEAAPANRRHEHFEIRILLQQHEADRPLAGDNFGIIEGVNEGAVFFVPELGRAPEGVVVAIAM